MRLRLLLIALIVWTVEAASDDYDNDLPNNHLLEDDKLKIEGDASIVIRSGNKLKVSCVFQGDEIADIHDLQWKNENGRSIDGESSSSVFTIALAEHHTGYKKRNLHFSAIDKRDEGNYTCEAKDLDGKRHQKKVNINVLAPIEWADKANTVGALIGEPLIIDCNAGGTPEPAMQITDVTGEPLDEDLFTIAGKEVTVEKLDKQYDGLTVSCVALQILTDFDTTSTEVKDVKIEVWYRPEFEQEVVDQYTIVGREATLVCNVSSSNPRPIRFTFFKDNHELNDPSKYELIQNVKEDYAFLKVLQVDSDDMGEYRCDVNNRKATGSQIINLKEATHEMMEDMGMDIPKFLKRRLLKLRLPALGIREIRGNKDDNPPAEVKATLEKTKKHSIIWKIDANVKDDELPIVEIIIHFIRKELLDRLENTDDANIVSVWEHQGTELDKEISPNGLYEVPGLRPDSEYTFMFRARSAAGLSDPVKIIASTEGEPRMKDDASSTTILASTLGLLLPLFHALLVL